MRNRVVALVCLLLTGCFSNPTNTSMLSYDKGMDPEVIEVMQDGDYALYGMYDKFPIVTYPLQRGDKLGFERGERGRIVAIAGNNRVTVEDKGYSWQKKP
jgi:hypothetical protein